MTAGLVFLFDVLILQQVGLFDLYWPYLKAIKFQYNAYFHWFKQRALWEYKAQNKRKLTPSSAKMADKFRIFLSKLFNLDEYFLNDLDSEV